MSYHASKISCEMLIGLQKETFDYFLKETNSENGLIADKTQENSPASVAVSGLGITVYIVGIERGFITREEAAKKILTMLQFFSRSQQSAAKDASGFKGFYYHFLDMKTGKRAWDSELSTIDTALLMAGVLSAATYFTIETKEEKEIRDLAQLLYSRVDWKWAQDGQNTLTHGWKPESGFLPHRWDTKYSEAIILYILALGSPTHAIEPQGYQEWQSTFEWKKYYGIEYLYAGPLFIHQLSHLWIDFRGIHDDYNRKVGIDYFENSRRATLVHQKYAIENPHGFKGYSSCGWGFTASDGPGPAVKIVDGKSVEFYNYTARGVPEGPDDGTISPWAVVASIPFAPEVVIETIGHAINKLDLKKPHHYGFDASYNVTFPLENPKGEPWVSPFRFGLNQGPIILMIENYSSDFVWKLMKKNEFLQKGLAQAGFRSATA